MPLGSTREKYGNKQATIHLSLSCTVFAATILSNVFNHVVVDSIKIQLAKTVFKSGYQSLKHSTVSILLRDSFVSHDIPRNDYEINQPIRIMYPQIAETNATGTITKTFWSSSRVFILPCM